MTITLSPEDITKYEQAVKEHQGKKVNHFITCVLDAFKSPWPTDMPHETGMKAMKRHNQEWNEPFPKLTKVLGFE